jgi:hypothetical protein
MLARVEKEACPMRQVSIVLPLAAALLAAGCAGMPRSPETQLAAADTVKVTCRDMLVPASNQIRLVCGTAEQWAKFERKLSVASQQQLRRLQGSPYTG